MSGIDKLDAMIKQMAHGYRVVAICRNMSRAMSMFHEARKRCDALGIDYRARKNNGRPRIDLGDGWIIFASPRAELRGCSCDVVIIDEMASYRDWMGPMMATAKVEL